jgi:predicted nucleotidyltransferase
MIVPEMGTQGATVGLADALFTPVQQRVLGLLFGQPDRSFQSSELIRLARGGTGAVHRQVERLVRVGLVRTRRIGNQKHYQADRDSPIFEELRSLVGKTLGVVAALRESLAPKAHDVVAAFVYGSIASRTDTAASDIDLLVISDVLRYEDVFGALQSAEARIGRTISPRVLTRQEWRRKLAQPGSFVARIAERPRLFVLGSDDEFR